MIEYSIRIEGNKYLACVTGSEPLVLNVKKPGWWISFTEQYGMYFSRASIWVYERSNGKKDINFNRDDGLSMTEVGRITIVNDMYTARGISIADQIILEKMVDRVRNGVFRTTLTRRKVKP